MKIIGVIPARMKSGRFPGKPMARIHGIPMVGHCYYRSRLSTRLERVYVATPDEEVFDYITSIGGDAIMTGHHHQMCTDRVAEATGAIEKRLGHPVEIVVNIQGDQPMVFPDMIDDVVQPLLDDPTLRCATMVDPIRSEHEFDDPNRVKVVMDLEGNALYFSREPIPSRKKFNGTPVAYKHVALIPFRRNYLMEFSRQPMSPLETVESVDYLRVLEHGHRMRVVITERKTETVDTPGDLRAVETLMEDDPLLPEYARLARAG